MKVLHHFLAREDVAEVLGYYEREAGLDVAVDFFDDLNRCIDSIARHPRSFPERVPGIRRCLLKQFPHEIGYEIVDKDTVRILVVKHQRRHPAYGMDRT